MANFAEYAIESAGVPPAQTNADTFGYNDRSEVVFSHGATENTEYSYDGIGNLLANTCGGATNTYTANNLNQYTSISNLCASVPPCEPSYDSDGNLLSDGVLTYAYDAGNRLMSVTSATLTNGAIRVVNAYDHRSRRIRKTVQRLNSTISPPPSPPTGAQEWQTIETRTFAWDGNNIVLESIGFADGSTRICEYFWGNDKSGTEQGAGGVGGLLAVSVDGVFYIPCYDHNGNIMRYVSEAGATAAQHLYDPYGNMVEASGPLTDQFSFGFSTKYHDRETGLVAYQQRFYYPPNGRWLNRDPIEEEGGENLYAFCGNNAISRFDSDGCAHFEVRRLSGLPFVLNYSCFSLIIGFVPAMILDFGLADKLNVEILHEHLFYDDGTNVGYNDSGEFSEAKRGYSRRDPTEYDDCIMKEAQKRIPKPPYSLIGIGNPKFNCQDYADSLRREYNRIKDSKEVKCKCKNKK